MRHRKNKVTLDRKKSARVALLKGLAASLILHERITTTKAKARAVKSFVEPLVTRAKTNTVPNMRHLLKYFSEKNVVKKAFEVLGPRYQSRPGGYTRIVPVGQRKGDAAEMAMIEFI